MLVPGNCEYTISYSKGRTKVALGIRLRSAGFKMFGPDYAGGTNVMTSVLGCGRKGAIVGIRGRLEDAPSCFRDGERAVRRGMPVATRKWKRRGKGLSPGASSRNPPADILILVHGDMFQGSDISNGNYMNLCLLYS